MNLFHIIVSFEELHVNYHVLILFYSQFITILFHFTLIKLADDISITVIS